MTEQSFDPGYRTYWMTWGILVGLSLLMIATDTVAVRRGAVAAFLILVMLVKAALIGGTFMHLRFERRSLTLAVAAAMLGTAAVLILLLAADALHVARLSPR